MGSTPEELVVIRTYADEMSADAAQVELHNAGIHSLLFSDSAPLAAPPPGGGSASGIGLAVHRRDVKLAEAVLLITPSNPA